jgi:endo-1,4-beta-xylanase
MFHVLVWGNQQPRWIESLPATEQLEEIREWYEAVHAQFPDIDYLQVVNEPLHDPPAGSGNGNYINALGGSGDTGWDWVITAFEMAREIFPDTTLMINDYNIINNDDDTQRYRELIGLLQARGLIDAIGVQGHAFSLKGSADQIVRNLDVLGATGMPIFVTEFEVDGANEGGPRDDAMQLSNYENIFPAIWEHPSVAGITMWGYRPGMWRDNTAAYLVLDDSMERPAMTWLKEYMAAYEDPQWFGSPVLNYWADASSWLGGEVYVGYSPWIYAESLGWVYVAEDTVGTDGGGWVYVLR